MKINLGAGIKHIKGFKSIDFYSDQEKIILKKNNIDFFSGDVFDYLKEVKDNSVEEIYSRHFFEHLTYSEIKDLLVKLERILIKDGIVKIIVPHWGNPYYYSDPTHKTFFGLYSFEYLIKKPYFKRKVPSYSQITNLHIKDVNLNFITFKILRPFAKFLSCFLNLNSFFLELYEALFANIFPPYEIEFILEKN